MAKRLEIVRYESGNGPVYGDREGAVIHEWAGGLFDGRRSGRMIDQASIRLLPPVAPSKFVLASVNFEEALTLHNLPRPKNPILFLKAPSSIVPDGAPIEYPDESKYVTFEPELALVIARECRRVSAASAMDYVFGYTLTNDLSARDIQNAEGQYTRCKSMDTFGPLGPSIVTGIDASDLRVSGYINGKKVAERRTSSLIFDIPTLISFTSYSMTLNPGDVISTGAGGVAEIKVGDTVTVEVENVGRLTNPVIAQK